MAHTFTNLLTHIVFSTKDRELWLSQEIKPRLWGYIGGILRELDGSVMAINGPPDHVHILASLSSTHSLAETMRTVKTNSSRWIHETFPTHAGFAWQNGYGAFSVSQSNIESVRAYVADQEAHHRTMTFKDEYIALLNRHGMTYDTRYLWE